MCIDSIFLLTVSKPFSSGLWAVSLCCYSVVAMGTGFMNTIYIPLPWL